VTAELERMLGRATPTRGVGVLIEIEKIHAMQRFGPGSSVVDWIRTSCP